MTDILVIVIGVLIADLLADLLRVQIRSGPAWLKRAFGVRAAKGSTKKATKRSTVPAPAAATE